MWMRGNQVDKEKIVFERLRQGELLSHRYYNKPLMIAYSGGKDSDVLVELAIRSGIDFEVVHSHTTADAPETVRYIRKRFSELEDKGVKCNMVYPKYKGSPITMWSLIPLKGIPPTRKIRYCCEILKENSGNNRVISTGVRWSESKKRSSRGMFEATNKNKEKRIILMDENTEDRRFIERCQLKSKISINPIVDWTETDVWDYLHDCRCPSNPLYQCGFKRVGCVGCPMAGKNSRWREFHYLPKYKDMYIKSFDKMLDNSPLKKKSSRFDFKNGYDVFLWWMEENPEQTTFEAFFDI